MKIFWDSLVGETKQAYDDGTLDRGRAHLSVNLEDWRTFPIDEKDPRNWRPALETQPTEDRGDLPRTFPGDWNWHHYEPAFKELMERLAQTQEVEAPRGDMVRTGYGLTCTNYEAVKLIHWWKEQVSQGRLPPDDVILGMGSERGRRLDGIFDRKLAEARLQNRGE